MCLGLVSIISLPKLGSLSLFHCEKLKFFLFADDTNILYADKNLRSLELIVNQGLCKLYDWLLNGE